MNLELALFQAAEKAGWSVTKVAAEAGVTEGQARKWLAGTAKPRFEQLQALRRNLPGFADRLDGKAVA